MRKFIIIFIELLFISLVLAESGYKLPPGNIVKIFDTPAIPSIYFIPFGEIGFEITYQKHQNLEQLSDPSEKLAGIELSKKLNAPMDMFPLKYIKIHNLKKNTITTVKLPENIKLRSYRISFDYKKLAITYETETGIKLIIADVSSGKSKIIKGIKINDIFEDTGIFWLNDNKTLLIKSIPENRGKAPKKPLIPNSPIIEETSGKTSTIRTYQNLLKDKFDEILFDYYFTSQLILLDTEKGTSKKIGNSAIYEDIDISPDNKYILLEKIKRPYSCMVPYYYFTKKYEIINMKGNLIKEIYERPLQDQIPIGGTYIGPRRFQWQPLKDASLIWVEALDEGNPKNKVDFRDKVMRFNAPFSDEPEEIFKIKQRYSWIDWSENEDELIYYEYDRDKLWQKGWLFKIGKDKSKLVYDLSINDNYNYPGYLVMKKTKNGYWVFVKNNDYVYFINNKGATPDGNFPYLAKYNFQTKKKKILFKCQENFFETISGFIGKDFHKIVIRSENKKNPPNYFFVDLRNGKKERITNYPNPYPEITNLKKELVTYIRKDSISLSGELYFPANYKKGERLPLVIDAYPEEYTNRITAGQVDSTPNKFINFWGASIKYFVLQGYAVLSRASIPIVGNPETVNETFIEQTVGSVEAAINYLDERGIIDPKRVGITGHSYGAFMVANVLAHSELCAAGIAKSGAYNRALTPFGFQSERRTFWEAKDFYIKVSPFMFAEKIKAPILLIHGEDDDNSGTFPLQSKRFYQALKGNGATARLVILPYEGHGYSARESNLHVLSEMIEWFDKYVKK
ncbi:MAG: S9 family peptidase [Bacteroidetes bacterium]|nr:MAG: S9 family peptidase [Bacteroidota bacterium]